jgi:protein-S-isoprenylcysteine O-methyltransferase Ste14
MKTIFMSPKGLDARGVGPMILRLTIPVIMLGIISQVYRSSWFQYPWKEIDFIRWMGVILVIIGAVFFFAALIHFIIMFPTGKLITNGTFALSRNPFYASWMVLLLPGLSLMLNNWLFLFAAGVMYLAFQRFIGKEEQAMKDAYGAEYDHYKARVGRILPGRNP